MIARTWCRRGAGAVLVLAVALAPLPFGSVGVAWATALRGAVLVATVAALLAADFGTLRGLRAPVAAMLLLAALGLAQTLPWPAEMVAIVSPAHAELATEAGTVGGTPASTLLTLSPYDTVQAVIWWCFAAAALVTAGIAARERTLKVALLASVGAGALMQLALGLRPWRAGSDTIWGVVVPGDPTRLRGSFVNPDHLSTYLELTLALLFACGWWTARRASREPNVGMRVLLLVPPIVAWLLVFVGLAFTGSRAGLVAATLGLIAQAALLGVRSGRWSVLPVAVLAAASGLGYAAFVNVEAGFGRWIATSSYELTYSLRRAAYSATIDLWARFPILGSGLGSFREAFPLVQPEGASSGLWNHAHNGYLETLATGGVVGLLVLLGGTVLTFSALGRGLGRDSRSLDRASSLAAAGALVSAGFHETFEFALTIPANSLALAVLVGAGLVRSHSGATLGAELGAQLHRRSRQGTARHLA